MHGRLKTASHGGRIRRLIEAGAVYVDGKRVRVASRKVRPPARFDVYVDDSPAVADPKRTSPVRVLYEDEDLIAVDKPSGVAAQATLEDAKSDLFTQVRRFLGRRDGAPAYLALHHRLDRGTSGIMVFAKQHRANRGLAEAFAGQRVSKLYQALSALEVAEPPAQSWVSSNYLSSPQDLGEGPRRVFSVEAVDGRLAETEFRVVRSFPNAVWVEAVPRTGRTHQIRVHLGGKRVAGARRFALWARNHGRGYPRHG